MRPVLGHAARVLVVSAFAALMLGAAAGSQPLARPPLTGWLTYGNAATRAGDASRGLSASSLRPAWFADVEGMVTTQPLVARNVPSAGRSTVYVGLSSGSFEALAPNGYVRWSANLGVIPNRCDQLPTWGVTGTPVIDAATRAVYVADAFGWLHSLDLATGTERAGWPVRLYDDPGRELVWGALADVRGSIYVATGSYCDDPVATHLVRVEIASRLVTSWIPVPAELGGGGAIWGWGGIAYSAAQDALFVATGNAFEGGSNRGAAFSEAAGYGEQLVELNRDLRVVGASHAPEIPNGEDSDFIGSPVIARTRGCGEIVGAANKNGELYLWHAGDIASGPFASIPVQGVDFDHPLLTNAAWNPVLQSFYVVTFTELVRVTLDDACRPSVAWRRPFGKSTLNSSPTVAGALVWLALSGKPATLLGIDARSGAIRFRREIGGMSFAAPTVIDGRLFEDARHGFATAGAARSRGVNAVGTAPGSTSWSDARHGWESRETGVFATENGGRAWRRVFARPAQNVLRTSPAAGVISVGSAPSACNCTARRLWTRDGGRTWHETPELGASFAGRGRALYWWSDSMLEQVIGWPPRSGSLRSRLLARFAEPIADAAPTDGGVAVLLTDAGHGWDDPPHVELDRGGRWESLDLPATKGEVLAVRLAADWPRLTVTGLAVDGPPRSLAWRSNNGGRTWTVASRRG